MYKKGTKVSEKKELEKSKENMYKNRNCMQLTNSNFDPGSIVQWRIIIPLIRSRVPEAKPGQGRQGATIWSIDVCI